MATQPNILFILADQHNAKCLGHKGHPNVRTPNLDQLAADGVRFDNAITQNPICTPSRVSFISGQYCHNHGYYGLSGPNPDGLPTLFGHFRAANYLTAAVGKIHCPEYWVEDDCDIFHETTGCSVGGRSDAYTNFLKERGKEALEDHVALTEFGDRGRQSMEGRPSPLTFEESQEGWIAAACVDAMKQAREAGKPFFVHASFPRPHQCTAPSQEFWDLYENDDLVLPPNADYEPINKAPHFSRTMSHWKDGKWTLIEPKTFAAGRLRKLRGYLAAISQVDHAVGVMLQHLADNGLANNTIVIYTSDHGDYATEHGLMEKAPGICADAITRIPMIWRWPGRFKARHVANELVEAVDVSKTLCGLAGLADLETSDGKDLHPLLNGQSGELRQIAVTEFPWSRSVRKGDFRLVYYPPQMFADEYPDGFGELYNLAADPWEMTNLFFEPEHQGKVNELRHDLLDWLISTTRPVTVNGIRSGSAAPTQATHRYGQATYADGKISPRDFANCRTTSYL